jgi:hypothetical protein
MRTSESPGLKVSVMLQVHGILHLLDYDHEESEEEEAAMAEEEQRILAAMGWKGKGLIEAMNGEAPKPGKSKPGKTSFSTEGEHKVP